MKKRTQSLVAILLCVMMLVTSLMTLTVSVSAEDEGVVTAYGTIPADQAEKAFAIFMNGKFVTAVDNWNAVWYRTDYYDNKGCETIHKLLRDNPGATVTILLLKDANTAGAMLDQASLGHLAGGNVVFDLGGHTLTVNTGNFIRAGLIKDDYDAYMKDENGAWLEKYGGKRPTTNLTVKSGTVLGGKANIFYVKSDSTKDGSGTANVDFQNVNFGFIEDQNTDINSYDIVFRGWGGSATTLFTVNTSFTNCSFDSRNYENRGYIAYNKDKFITWFYDGGNGSNSKITYKVDGGSFISDKSDMKVHRGTSADANTVFSNKSGRYPTFSVPDGSTWQNGQTMKLDGDKTNQTFVPNVLVEDGTDYDVYTLPDVVTPYGTIAQNKVNESFAIFMNGEFVAAFGDWNAVWYRTNATQYENYVTVHKLLKENPGANVTILVRKDKASNGAMADQAALGHLAGGNITVDLGGHTLTATSDGFIKPGVFNASYDDYLTAAGLKKQKTSLTVKNGKLLQQGYLFYPKNGGGSEAKTEIIFDNVTFGFGDNVQSNHDIVFRGWGGTGTTPSTINTLFKNCIFDSTTFEKLHGASKKATWFGDWYNSTNPTNPITNFTVEGCQFITDGKMNIGSIRAGRGSLVFDKTESGSYATFTVPNDSTWQNGQSVKIDGAGSYTYNPKMLVEDGTDYDVYTLPDVVTPYGAICPDHAYSGNFAVFYDGQCQITVNDWGAAWYRTPGSTHWTKSPSVIKILFDIANGDKANKDVVVYVRSDLSNAGAMSDAGYLGHMAGGNVIVDLGGHTVTVTSDGFFKLGLHDTANDQYLTDAGITKSPVNVTVKNGTLLQKGYIFYVKNPTEADGETNITFDGVTFGFASDVASNHDIVFRGWGAGYDVDEIAAVPYIVNANFTNCTFDSSVFEGKYSDKAPTWFFDAGTGKSSTINFTVDGGQFITNGKMSVVNDNAKDTLTFVNTSGSYATIEVPNGVTPDVWVPTDLGEANFPNLIIDGADRDVYALQTYEQINTQYLVYVEYNGEKLYKNILIPTGADYTAVYLDPAEYASMLESVKKGSIRLGAPAGLRFATEIDPALLALFDQLLADGDIASVEFGTLVAPASYGFDNGFTIEELQALGRQYLNIVAGYGNYFAVDEDESTTHFVGSVVNLYEKSVTLTFRGKGYAKVVLNSGEIVMLYAGGHDTSVQSVANTAKYGDSDVTTAYYNSLSDANKSIIDAFIAGKVPSITQSGDNSRNLNGLNVLTIGDSLFEGHTLLKTESWIGQLATRYNWNLTNLGKNGATVAVHPNDETYSIYQQLMVNDEYCYGGGAATHTWGNPNMGDKVDLILVEGGVNDWRKYMTLGTLDDTDGTTVLGAWKLIIEQLKTMYPDAKIVLVTSWEVPGPRTINGVEVDRLDYTDSLQTIYEAFYTEDENVFLVDAGNPELSGILMTDKAFKAAYTYNGNDDNHLNAKGMEIMANYMSSELKKLFSDVQP